MLCSVQMRPASCSAAREKPTGKSCSVSLLVSRNRNRNAERRPDVEKESGSAPPVRSWSRLAWTGASVGYSRVADSARNALHKHLGALSTGVGKEASSAAIDCAG